MLIRKELDYMERLIDLHIHTNVSDGSFKSNEIIDMAVKNGRYGAYIAYKGKNYRIPRGKKAELLTYAECLNIVNTTKK